MNAAIDRSDEMTEWHAEDAKVPEVVPLFGPLNATQPGTRPDRTGQSAKVVTTSAAEPKPKIWAANDLAGVQQPRWLAKGRIPRASISLLVGDEGIGKSLYWVWLAHYITTGKALPEYGIPERAPGNVLLIVTEDEWASTVLPRLIVAGVNLDRVQVICAEKDGSGSPVFPRDMFLVTDAIPKPALIVVDAWLDTVTAGLSIKDAQQARRALHPWKDAATHTDAAVLLLTHTNRITTSNARDMYGGSAELRKKARMALLAKQDDDGHLLIGPEKANGTAKLRASKFRIEAVQHFAPSEDHDGTVPKLIYTEESDRTAGELVADTFAGDDAEAVDTIDTWLRRFLEDKQGSCESVAALEAAEKHPKQYSSDQLNRAKRRHRYQHTVFGATAGRLSSVRPAQLTSVDTMTRWSTDASGTVRCAC